MKARYFAIPAGVLAIIATGALLLQWLTDPGSPRSAWPPPRDVKAARSSLAPAPVAGDADVRSGEQVTIVTPGSSEAEKKTSEEPAPDKLTPDPQSAYVQQRIQELQDLAMDNEPASLKSIMSELSNPDREIRKAALDATIQFSSRDAIPGLRDAAARATDPKEKAALEDAIEFLKLPSLTEVMQEKARNSAAPAQPGRGAAGAPAQFAKP